MKRWRLACRTACTRLTRFALVMMMAAVMIPAASPPAIAVSATPVTYWVDSASGTDLAGRGSEAEPFRTITFAVSQSTSFDTIMVKPGIYDDSTGEVFPIQVLGQSLVGASGSSVTVIDGDNTKQLLNIQGWASSDKLEGFTIRDGGTFAGMSAVSIGGMAATPASLEPMITGCSFFNCNGTQGGAISFGLPAGTNLIVEDSVFENNAGVQGGALGGSVYGTLLVRQNTFNSNAGTYGGVLYFYEATGGTVTIEGNFFSANTANLVGGAIYADGDYGTLAVVRGNDFLSNTALHGGVGYLANLTLVFERNQVIGSTASGQGGFCYLENADVTALSNYITASQSSQNGAVWTVDPFSSLIENGDTVFGQMSGSAALHTQSGSTVIVTNCIYWNPNLGSEIYLYRDPPTAPPTINVSFTCSRDSGAVLSANGCTVGVGMLYTAPTWDTFGVPRLDPDSDCIDAGNPSTYPADDIYGTTRPQDGDANGTATCDIGCYEYRPPNVAPVAVGESYSTNEDTPLVVEAASGVLNNDTDADDDALTAIKVTNPAHGTLSLDADGSFTYTPAADYSGADSFTYKANDALLDSNVATVDITVTAVNDPPVLSAIGDKSGTVGSPVTFSASATDIDLPAQTLTYSLVDPPAGATIDPVTGAFSWTPSAAGAFPVTVRVSDGIAVDAEEITISVAPIPTHTVTFKDWDGTILKTQAVDHGSAATAPADPTRAGFTFVGWDVAFTNVTADLTVTATYTYDGVVWETVGGVDYTRVAGTTRYDTAAQSALDAFPHGASTAVVAFGRSFADALAASPLAGAVNGPILLTETDTLPAATAQAIEDLGITTVYIVGGTGVVSEAVEAQLDELGVTEVIRKAGPNRYITARVVAEEAVALGASTTEAFLVRGDDFADALAVSSIAAQKKIPILLTTTASLNAEAEAFLTGTGTDAVYIAGGTGAVSDATAASVVALGATVTRWDGPDRYATGAKVVSEAMKKWTMPMDDIGIASGANYPDALAGGAVLGYKQGLLLLTDPTRLSAATEGLITANKATITSVEYFGGTGALSSAVSDRVEQLLE